jgi:DNA modification methylase
MIRNRIGDPVLEPFSGSGSAIIAGEQTGRVVYALELDPLYVDWAIQRWERFTGKKAKLVR